MKSRTLFSLGLAVLAASWPAADAQAPADTKAQAPAGVKARGDIKARDSAITNGRPRGITPAYNTPEPPSLSKRKSALTYRRSIPPPPPLSSMPMTRGRSAKMKSALIPGQFDTSKRVDQSGRPVGFYPAARGLEQSGKQVSAQREPKARPK